MRMRKQGQSLVEIALITPILLLMLLGLFEVGYAIRGYLVIANANREATRFAARGRYVDFVDPNAYQEISEHFVISVAGQVPLTTSNVSLAMTHLIADTGVALEEQGVSCGPITMFPKECNCVAPFYEDAAEVVTATNIVYDGFYFESRIVLDDYLERMRAFNETQNCRLWNQDISAVPLVDSRIVVETVYLHKQLLGAPIISNLFPDPVPLYVSTTMRVVSDARGSANDD